MQILSGIVMCSGEPIDTTITVCRRVWPTQPPVLVEDTYGSYKSPTSLLCVFMLISVEKREIESSVSPTDRAVGDKDVRKTIIV